MSKPLVVVYGAILLDAVGIGLVFPILPTLLADISGGANVAAWIGLMTALYAVMQFVFAPVLGALSDRLGRRPILVLSLAGAALDYLLLATAPNLWLLLVGRAIAGLTSANVAVATAYLTDVSADTERPRRFGLLNAMFGAGFIIGPVLGGLLGAHWVRLPFVAAALLNAANLALALLVLPESRARSHAPLELAALNPLRPLRWIVVEREVRPVVLVFFLFAATGEAYGVCWALWGGDAFGWDGLRIGLSLGAFGICQTVAQAFLPGPAVRRIGERRAVLLGVAGAVTALVVLALAPRGWIVFAIMPVFALGGIGVPALQSFATRQVGPDLQGRLQGVLASAVSLASIVAPLGFSAVYTLVRSQWPGAVWLTVAALYLVTVPAILRLRLPAGAPPQ